MIDINELRFTAAKSTRDLALLPSEVNELLDRLEAAEKEREIDEERIADLMADLNRVGHENDALRAKIAEMEQRPCDTATKYDWYYAHGWNECLEAIKQKLACAKGE